MLFSALDERLQADLRKSALRRQFGEGAMIQQRGDVADGFWLLESGSVAVGQFLPEGEFRAAALLGPGDSWGELAMFARQPRVVDAIARSPCTALYVRAGDLETRLASHPQAMRALLAALSAQLQELLDMIAGIRKGTAKPRVAGLLANLAGNPAGGSDIAITQHEIGELLGLSRATVNASLRELEAAGLIERSYGRIDLLDLDRLRLVAIA